MVCRDFRALCAQPLGQFLQRVLEVVDIIFVEDTRHRVVRFFYQPAVSGLQGVVSVLHGFEALCEVFSCHLCSFLLEFSVLVSFANPKNLLIFAESRSGIGFVLSKLAALRK
nr:MAG TPA: hypothetical protein [Caudoviricetes sp.]